MLSVGFAGTPEFARVALQALYQNGFAVPVVLTQPDRPSGRGLKLQPSPVKQLALQHDSCVLQPQSLRQGQEATHALHTLCTAGTQGKPLDVLVVAAYGLILPQAVLNAPRLGCINIHASLLPRWRGAAPIHRAIEAGDKQTGVCIMQMDTGLDTGPVLLQEAIAIAAHDTTATVHNTLAALGAKLIVNALEQLHKGTLEGVAQPLHGITYAQKISKLEARIDWQQPATTLQQRIRAFDPNPGAHCLAVEQTIKCFEPQCIAPTVADTAPGTVLAIHNEGVVVQCGQGALQLAIMQKPGGKRSPASQVLAALGLGVGCVLA